jgi:hypothetical protein
MENKPTAISSCYLAALFYLHPAFMHSTLLSNGLFWILALTPFASAQAQSPVAAASTTPAGPAADRTKSEIAGQLARYTVAHDTLMMKAANVHAQAEARMGYFRASHGTFNGLYSRSRAFTGIKGPVVKRQRKKHLFGTTLTKVRYYDERRRKVLTERYVGQKLTYLKLVEYPSVFNTPSAKWVFAEGDYLWHVSLPLTARRQSSYYFNPRPAAE